MPCPRLNAQTDTITPWYIIPAGDTSYAYAVSVSSVPLSQSRVLTKNVQFMDALLLSLLQVAMEGRYSHTIFSLMSMSQDMSEDSSKIVFPGLRLIAVQHSYHGADSTYFAESIVLKLDTLLENMDAFRDLTVK